MPSDMYEYLMHENKKVVDEMVHHPELASKFKALVEKLRNARMRKGIDYRIGDALLSPDAHRLTMEIKWK